MRRFLKLILATLLTLSIASACKERRIDVKIPDGYKVETFTYAVKDSDSLRLDVYRDTSWDTPHPAVIFSFGGGWCTGSRKSVLWASRFVDDGYAFVSIDYRKSIKSNDSLQDSLNFATLYGNALNLAIEDLFDASSYIVENASSLMIDPEKIVASGSSAGAINSVTAEWMICSSDKMAAEHLPEGFNYAGIISMAGAVWKHGSDIPSYAQKPCPHLFLHGTKDDAVAYEMMEYPQCDFYGFGPGILTNVFKENSWPFYSFTVEDADHYMCYGPDIKIAFPNEKVDYTRVVFDFLERNVHENLPVQIEYLEKDLDGARTWARIEKAYKDLIKSPKLIKQFNQLPEFGSRNVEMQTYDFAVKEGDTLRMDIFRDPAFSGKRPVLLYSFGGGWESGNRFIAETSVMPLAPDMAKKGFVVVSYDYRLKYREAKKKGLVPNEPIARYLFQEKGKSDSSAFYTMLDAIEIAVEDLYDATVYLIENADSLNIDPEKIVIMGGSAGAFNCLTAEYWLCNDFPISKRLPENFRYAGVVSCAGAIFHNSDEILEWKKVPSPILFYHGTSDSCVAYDKAEFPKFNYQASGPASIIGSLDQVGASYILYSSIDRDHDMAMIPGGYMDQFTTSFIDRLVFNGEKIQAKVVETWDPSVINPTPLYLFGFKQYPMERIIEDYKNYFINAWD